MSDIFVASMEVMLLVNVGDVAQWQSVCFAYQRPGFDLQQLHYIIFFVTGGYCTIYLRDQVSH